jgi:hypothetical protein
MPGTDQEAVKAGFACEAAAVIIDTARSPAIATRAMHAEIYNWFTESFDTDLKDARTLLDELSAQEA